MSVKLVEVGRQSSLIVIKANVHGGSLYDAIQSAERGVVCLVLGGGDLLDRWHTAGVQQSSSIRSLAMLVKSQRVEKRFSANGSCHCPCYIPTLEHEGIQ